MLLLVILSSLLISLGLAASCKSITIFGSAYIPIDHCYEITIFGFSASTKYTCGGETGVLSNEYHQSGCNEQYIQNSTAITFDNPDLINYDCDSSTLCDVTILKSAVCSACTDNDGCTENGLFSLQFGFVTGQCIVIPQIYLNAYNANRTAYGKDNITTVAIQFECEESVGIELVAYDDSNCTQKSTDQSIIQGVEEEAENDEDDAEGFKIGCSGACNGGFDCYYISLTCAANQFKTLFAVFIAIFISISL